MTSQEFLESFFDKHPELNKEDKEYLQMVIHAAQQEGFIKGHDTAYNKATKFLNKIMSDNKE